MVARLGTGDADQAAGIRRLRAWVLALAVLAICPGPGIALAQSVAGASAANQLQDVPPLVIPPPRTPIGASQVGHPAVVQLPIAQPPIGQPGNASATAAGQIAGASPASAGGAVVGGAPGNAGAPVAAPLLDLNATQQTLTQIQSQALATTDDSRLVALRDRSAVTETAADGLISARSNDLKTIDRQLGRFAVSGKRKAVSAAERREQSELLARREAVERQLKQAQTVANAASQAYDVVAERRRDSFSARVFEQTASPVSPAFWTSLSDAVGADSRRLLSVARHAVDTMLQAPEPGGLLSFVIALAVAVALVFPVRRRLERLVRARSAADAHRGFRLTTHAVWIAVVDTVLPGLAANALHLGAAWGGLLSEKANALAGAAVIAISWGAAVVALGRATVASDEPDNRLMPVPDDAVARVRFYLWMVALITGAGFLLKRLNDVVGASVAATIAANCVMSLAYVGVAGLVLVSFGRNRTPIEQAETSKDAARSSSWTLFSLVLSAAIILTVGAVLTGYTTLAVLISSQIFWLSMVGAVTYLLLLFIEDLCAVLFHGKGWAARTLVVLFNLRHSSIDQIGVLVSAGLQIVVLLGALTLALTPFGQSGADLLSHFGRIGRAVHIGSAVLSPSAVLTGLVSLVVGMAIVHLVRGWLVRRYMPVTDWDAGVRNSVSTGVGYVGVGVTVLCALAAMGLGFKQIALVASALSVGIGFGLQQVVQNFVSGIILLIERPVKVGDWVNVAGVEGDVRSIRVRATEIQTFDRTTLIVPNSDLITKTVQNKTLGDPRGRIQLQLSIANPADARRAAELILQAAKSLPAILSDPTPNVFIDSLAAAGSVNFNCFLYVQSPRDVYKTRSALYYAVLDLFLENKIAFLGAAGAQHVELEPGPQLRSLLDASGVLAPADLAKPTLPAEPDQASDAPGAPPGKRQDPR